MAAVVTFAGAAHTFTPTEQLQLCSNNVNSVFFYAGLVGVHKHQSTARCEASGQGLCRCWGGQAMGVVNADGAAIYKYLNFNQIDEYVENAKGVTA